MGHDVVVWKLPSRKHWLQESDELMTCESSWQALHQHERNCDYLDSIASIGSADDSATDEAIVERSA
jgi:hypothetical protein